MSFAVVRDDGRNDVLTCNGHLEPEIAKVQTSQSYKQPPQLFWNAGEGESEFVRVPADFLSSDFATTMVGRGSAGLLVLLVLAGVVVWHRRRRRGAGRGSSEHQQAPEPDQHDVTC
jgi:hypothetical protein